MVTYLFDVSNELCYLIGMKKLTFTNPEVLLAHVRASSNSKLEGLLTSLSWHPYRRDNWFDRTLAFVKAFDLVRTAMMSYWSIGDDAKTSFLKASGSSLKAVDRISPWAREVKGKLEVAPNWKHWVSARQSADKRGMIYEDYVSGAIVAARLRGWPACPAINQLTSAKLLIPGTDGYVDATIEAFVTKKYAKLMRLTNDFRYTADQYVSNSYQYSYYAYVASEILRVNPGVIGFKNLKAERVWSDLQNSGHVPNCLSLSSMIQDQSALTTVA